VQRAPQGAEGEAVSVDKDTRARVLARDDFECRYCGRPVRWTTSEIDHVRPRCQGGGDELSNLVTACLRCNDKKGGFTPGEWAARELRGLAMFEGPYVGPAISGARAGGWESFPDCKAEWHVWELSLDARAEHVAELVTECRLADDVECESATCAIDKLFSDDGVWWVSTSDDEDGFVARPLTIDGARLSVRAANSGRLAYRCLLDTTIRLAPRRNQFCRYLWLKRAEARRAEAQQFTVQVSEAAEQLVRALAMAKHHVRTRDELALFLRERRRRVAQRAISTLLASARIAKDAGGSYRVTDGATAPEASP
jgi:hypothetical protein